MTQPSVCLIGPADRAALDASIKALNPIIRA